MSSIDTKLFRSKLGRRIFGMFVCCAMIPIFVLSVLAFSHVSKKLKDDAYLRLRKATKAYGMAVFEKLLFLETELKILASSLTKESVESLKKNYESVGDPNVSMFDSMLLIPTLGDPVTIFGDLTDPPQPSADDLEVMHTGKSIVKVQHRRSQPPRIFMLYPLNKDNEKSSYLMGKINTDYLWGKNGEEQLPTSTELIVLDASNQLLTTTLRRLDVLYSQWRNVRTNTFSRNFEWEYDNETHLANYRELFLKAKFSAPKWTVILSQSKATILAPIRDFKLFFSLLVLMSFGVVLLLSIVYIRKTMGPLESLKEGTNRILNGDYHTLVEVKTGDEVEALAASFNEMSVQIGEQFKALSTVAEIGRTTSSVLNIQIIVNRVLSVMNKMLDFDRGFILLANKEKTQLLYAGDFGFSDEKSAKNRNLTIPIQDKNDTRVFAKTFHTKKMVVIHGNADVPAENHNAALSIQKGESPKICVPIIYEDESIGLLTVETDTQRKSITQSDQSLLQAIASHMAKAAENALTFQRLQESEAALKASHDELEIRVDERTRELKETNTNLQSEISERKRIQGELVEAKQAADVANAAKSEFLANMSHELRTPLNHIIGFSQLLADGQLGEVNETQQEFLGDVLKSSNHLLSLINDILDLSKVEAGKLELEPAELDIKGLLEHSLVMIKEKAMKNGVRLLSEYGDIPETITADERKLKQIIYNLLSNAAKFTDKGGSITLTAYPIASDNGYLIARNGMKIELPHKEDGDAAEKKSFLELSVIDTGIGLEPEEIDKVFNPFEQAESSGSRKYQGTGLGLSLTKRLVELHGGRIWAHSQGKGKGATFSFVLPA